jgi:hypothetical protein
MRNAGAKSYSPEAAGGLRRDKKKEKNMLAPCGAYSPLLHSIFMYIPYLTLSTKISHVWKYKPDKPN